MTASVLTDINVAMKRNETSKEPKDTQSITAERNIRNSNMKREDMEECALDRSRRKNL